ncbi:MAG: hypothetical protein ACYS9X_32460 [Planctomycetota bacterium]|jgi:hypothetical protein
MPRTPALVLLLSAAACQTKCPIEDALEGPGTDTKSFVDDGGRPGGGIARTMGVGDTGLEAIAYPAGYSDEQDDDHDYFMISVERPDGRGRSRVLYERKLRLDMVAQDKLDAEVEDIVTYDPATDTVRFDLGKSSFEYVVP